MFSNIGPTELILILLIVLVFFGAKKIPDLASGLGKGIREFKKAVNDTQSEIQDTNKQLQDKDKPKS
jgi:sec-independent protein translocase protein TatA